MLESFFFNDTATTEIYTLSLHDALPIWAHASQLRLVRPRVGHAPAVRRERRREGVPGWVRDRRPVRGRDDEDVPPDDRPVRSEEHTSELQSRQYLVCRLLLEKKPSQYNR